MKKVLLAEIEDLVSKFDTGYLAKTTLGRQLISQALSAILKVIEDSLPEEKLVYEPDHECKQGGCDNNDCIGCKMDGFNECLAQLKSKISND